MIVVIDTNVWISAFVFSNPNKPDSVPQLALNRVARMDLLATSIKIRAEIFRILTEKYKWNEKRATHQLDRFHSGALTVSPSWRVRLCRDPKDDMFLECAAEARADLLVTGDKDLLAMGSYLSTRIVTPAEYVELP